MLTELGDEGVQILAISPDPNERSQTLAEKLRARYRFLADRDLAVTRRYGLVHTARRADRGRDVPIPTTVVIDRRGIVRWLRVADNHQVQPDSADVARAARGLWRDSPLHRPYTSRRFPSVHLGWAMFKSIGTAGGAIER